MSDSEAPTRVKGSPEREEWKRKIERRLQSVMISLVVAGVVWMGNTLVELKVSSATTTQHLSNVDISLSGAYRASDAKRDMTELLSRMAATEALLAQHTTLIELNTRQIQEMREQKPRVIRPTVSAPAQQPHG